MAVIKNDAATQYGCRTMTIGAAAGGTGGTVFICDSFTPTFPSKTIEVTNQVDEPLMQVTYPAFNTAQVVVQLPFVTSAIVYPQLGWETTLTTREGASIVYYVAEASDPEGKSEQKKATITIRKRYN